MQVREMCLNNWFSLSELPLVDAYIAREIARRGDRNAAVAQMRAATDSLCRAGQLLSFGIPVTAVLVESLLERGGEDDEAEAAVDRLATAPGDDTVSRDITLLRLEALLACSIGDDTAYRELAERYRAMTTSSGFDGHTAWAEAMS